MFWEQKNVVDVAVVVQKVRHSLMDRGQTES